MCLIPYCSVVVYSIPVVGCPAQGVFKRKGAVGYIVLLEYETIWKIVVDAIRYKLLITLLAGF